jgi:hypothetical protein
MLTLTSITTTGVAEVHTASSTDLYRARNQYIEKYVGST